MERVKLTTTIESLDLFERMDNKKDDHLRVNMNEETKFQGRMKEI